MKKTTHLSIDTLSAEILENHRVSESWEKTGNDYNISGGMAYRIAMQGYEPKDNHIRAILGLPEMLPAPACAKCGKVHTTARCTEGRQPRRRWVRCAGHASGEWVIVKNKEE